MPLSLHRYSVWSSLPFFLFSHFVVHYTSFIHITTPGRYNFVVSYRDGITLSINNTVVVQDWRCQDHFNSQYFFLTFNDTGFVPFVLHYFSSGDAFGIQLSIQLPCADRYVDVSSCLFYLPPSRFFYSTSLAHYFVSTSIERNSPVFFGTSGTPSSYQITPQLPSGLQLINGVLQGTPLEAAPLTHYTVTAYQSDAQLATVLSFRVEKVTAPSAIIFFDEHGKPVTAITVTLYGLVNVTMAADVPVFVWSVANTLPDGLAFVPKEQRIVGHITKKFVSSVVWVSCSNNGGSTTSHFAVRVVGCDYGYVVYSKMNDGALMEVQVADDKGKVVVSKEMEEAMYELVLCVPPSVYTLHLLCKQAGSDCNFHLVREDDLVITNLYLFPGQKTEVAVPFNCSLPPVISTQSSVIYTQSNAPVTVWFAVTNPYYRVVVQPTLPPTVTFDQDALHLTGSFSSPGVFTYQFRVANPIGEAQLLFTVYVDHCPQNTSLILLQRKSTLLGEKLFIYRGTVPVYQYSFQVGPYCDMLCVPYDDYTIQMISSNQGWACGSDLVVTDETGHTWGSFILDASESSQSDTLHYSFLVDNSTSFLFLVNALAPSSSWFLPRFDDSAWSSGYSGRWREIPAGLATVYFRAKIEVSPEVTYLQVSLFLKEGVILYIDGVERGRENLPRGAIYHSTTASDSFEEYRWVDYTIPAEPSFLPFTVLAVELHRQHVIATSRVTFALNVCPFFTSSLLRSFSGNITSNDPVNATHPVADAFDGSPFTFWEATTLPAWGQLTFSDQRWVVDRVDIQIYDSRRHGVPNVIQIYGMTENEGVLLSEVRSDVLFPSPFSRASLFFDNKKPFSAYRLCFNSSLQDDSIVIASIALYQSTPISCSADGVWGPTLSGTTLTLPCDGATEGFMSRRCSRSGAVGVWTPVNRGCVRRSPSIGMVFFDAILVVTDCSEVEWTEQVRDVVKGALAGVLGVKDTSVKLPGSAGEVRKNVFCVRGFVRVEVPSGEKNVLMERYHRIWPDFTKWVQEQSPVTKGMSFVFEGELKVQQCYTVLWIVLGCAALFCVCVGGGIFLYRRWRRSRIVQFSKKRTL